MQNILFTYIHNILYTFCQSPSSTLTGSGLGRILTGNVAVG